MADDMERNRQGSGQTGQSGQQGSQSGQQGQKNQTGQQHNQFDEQKKGGQNQKDDENLDRQRRAS